MPAGDRAKFLDVLAEKVSAPNPLIASAAVAKLHLIRKSVSDSVQIGEQDRDAASAMDVEAYRRIEEILLGALGHVESQVFQEAFNSLVLTELPLSDATLLRLTQPEQARVAMALLDGIEAGPGGSPGRGRVRRRRRPIPLARQAHRKYPRMDARRIAGLTFAGQRLLGFGSLSSIRPRPSLLSGRWIFSWADGSQESVIALIDIPASSRALLAKAFCEMDDGPLKEAILRVFLTGPESALTPELFEACKTLNVRVVSEQDPLFKALLRRPGPELQVRLLDLLVSADVQKILQTESFERVLGSLALDAQRSQDLQRILLKLALGRFEADYQMPLPSEQEASRIRREKVSASLYEMILVELATTEGVDPEVIRQAGEALFGAGRIAKFKERFDALPTAQRQTELIRFFSTDKALFERQAWPIFLAGCLDKDGPQISKAALDALAVVNQSLAEEDRRLLILAIKLGVNSDELVELTLSAEPDLARQAMSLLRQLVHMSAAESQTFEALTDPAERMKNLAELEQRTIEFVAGKFDAMIYLDLNVEEKKGSRKAEDEGRSRYQPLRLSEVEKGRQEPTSLKRVPLPSSTLTLRHDGLQVIRASAGRRDLLLVEKDQRDRGRGTDKELTAPATTFRLDVAPLVLEGLKIASRHGQSFARQVDQYPLSERVSCEFKHLRFGVWEGTVRSWPTMKKSDRGSVWTLGEAVFYLDPLESLRDAPRPVQTQRKVMMMQRANEGTKNEETK